jgi:hypothetical protein
MHAHEHAGDVRAVPAQILERGFRLLVLREFREKDQPPALAVIRQHILRDVHRLQRHGIFFSCTFLPDVTQWLSERLGRPSLRPPDYPASPAFRNPAWPSFHWRQQGRVWNEGVETVEWHVEVTFADPKSFEAFVARWRDRLTEGGAPSEAGDRSKAAL